MKFYGADGNQWGADMLANSDGTFMLLGNSQLTSESPSQIYLTKVNANGLVLWEKFYGLNQDVSAKDIEATADGGYVIVADSRSPASGTDFLLITIDLDGNVVSTGNFTYPGVSDEIASSVTQILDGPDPAGFIVTGSTDYDNGPALGFESGSAVFARFDQDCTPYAQPWTDNAGADGDDHGIRVIQRETDLTKPDPFVFFGYSNSPSQNDASNTSFNYWMSKVSNYGGGSVGSYILEGSPSGSINEELGSVVAINTGSLANYILAGFTTANDGQDKVFISGVNDAGLSADDILVPQSVDHSLGNLAALEQGLRKVSVHPLQGGYLIGANNFSGGNGDIILFKLNRDGSQAWSQPIILGGPGRDTQNALHELPGGELLVFGSMQIGDDRQSKMALIKLDSNGKFNF